MGSLDRSVDAAVDMMHALKLPVISGKDSLSSTYRGKDGEVIKIPPVYTMSIFGRIPDVEKTVTSDIKDPGNTTLYLIGKPNEGLGGSTYLDVTNGSSSNLAIVDKEALPRTLSTVQKLIQSNIALSCHDVSEGGIATAVAEMCFGGDAGVELLLPNFADRESFLFSETAGCLIVEVPDLVNVYMEFAPDGVEIMTLGKTTTAKNLTARQYSDALGYTTIFVASIDELKQAWQVPMKEIFHG